MFRRIALLFALVLLAAACGTSTSSDDAATGDLDDSAASATTAQAPNAATEEADSPAEEEHDDDAAEHDAEEGAHEDAEEGAHEEDVDGDEDAAPPEEQAVAGDVDRIVEVSMTDLAFSPNSLAVTSGETITFHVSNDGNLVHEFRLSNAHRIEEHIAEGHEGHGDEGGDHHGDVDVVLELEAGISGELTVTFPEDATLFTEIACLIPGHYEAGMKGSLTYS